MKTEVVLKFFCPSCRLGIKNTFNENRSCIEIVKLCPFECKSISLMKTEVVLKLVAFLNPILAALGLMKTEVVLKFSTSFFNSFPQLRLMKTEVVLKLASPSTEYEDYKV